MNDSVEMKQTGPGLILKRSVRLSILLLGLVALLGACSHGGSKATTGNGPGLNEQEIQHMVIFSLPYPEGSEEAMKFLEDGSRILSAIPVVHDFQAFRQVSEKNDYQYGFSMVFAGQQEYSTYNNHPDHVAFVRERWEKEVTDFLEIDFKKP